MNNQESKFKRHSLRRTVAVAALLLAALVPGAALAQDDATAIRLVVNHADCGGAGTSTIDMTIGGAPVATELSTQGCVCNSTPLDVTYTAAAIVDLIGEQDCSGVEVTVNGSGNGPLYVAFVRVEITRTVSGTETICLFDVDDADCADRNLCDGSFLGFGTQTFSAVADSDGDGDPDCTDPDDDGDGANDDVDNCPTVANPGQEDGDGNGTGDACQPNVVTVPWLGDPNQPHQVFSGGQIVLQAVATSSAGSVPLASGTWDPGDGSGPQAVDVTNPLAVERTHTYNGASGQPFTATVRVVDTSGNSYTDTMKVVIQPKTLDVEVNMAIDKGLWHLHKQMTRTNVSPPTGNWTSDDAIAATASAVQAFEINGHRQTGNRAEDPYVDNTARGLAYVLQNVKAIDITAQTAGNPDTNGNGIGLEPRNGPEVYILGQVMDALVASGTPGAVATTGDPTSVAGRTYSDIVQDMADVYAFGQDDNNLGGWVYSWNSFGIDASASQWWAIGSLAAEVWGVTVPQWVKDENLSLGIPHLQIFNGTRTGTDCQCGYRDAGQPGSANGEADTASCMVMMILDGVAQTEDRFSCATEFFRRFWEGSSLKGNMYAMFAFTKAMRLAIDDQGNPDPIAIIDDPDDVGDPLDWYRSESPDPIGFARYLVSEGGSYAQQANGQWNSSEWVSNHLSTAWAIIILSPTVFELGPIADCSADPLIDGTVALGGNVTFDGSGSTHQDPNIALVTYEWNFQDGNNATGVTTNHAFASVGIYNVLLTVTDANGLKDSTTCPVDVREAGIPPNAEGGPYVFCEDAPYQLDASPSYDLDGNIVLYEWDWTLPIGDFVGPDATGVTTTAPMAAFPAIGVYDLGLRVTDNNPQGPLTGTEFTTVEIISAADPRCVPACLDGDGDGFGDPGNDACAAGPAQDCDDSDDAVNPDADEICDNQIDDDCDGDVDGADADCAPDCIDNDGDGFGEGADCAGPDCDDSDDAVNPDADEVCDNQIDDNCDGEVDEDCVDCVDADGDGYGDGADCRGADCDDGDADINPGEREDCDNGADDDCDGLVDDDDVDDCNELLVDLEFFKAEAGRRGVTLSWRTSLEIDTVGFRILRGKDDGREPLRISPEIIPARGTELAGADYEFVDNSRQKRGTVFYWLEDIDLYGKVTRHGPVAVQLDRPVVGGPSRQKGR